MESVHNDLRLPGPNPQSWKKVSLFEKPPTLSRVKETHDSHWCDESLRGRPDKHLVVDGGRGRGGPGRRRTIRKTLTREGRPALPRPLVTGTPNGLPTPPGRDWSRDRGKKTSNSTSSVTTCPTKWTTQLQYMKDNSQCRLSQTSSTCDCKVSKR